MITFCHCSIDRTGSRSRSGQHAICSRTATTATIPQCTYYYYYCHHCHHRILVNILNLFPSSTKKDATIHTHIYIYILHTRTDTHSYTRTHADKHTCFTTFSLALSLSLTHTHIYIIFYVYANSSSVPLSPCHFCCFLYIDTFWSSVIISNILWKRQRRKCDLEKRNPSSAIGLLYERVLFSFNLKDNKLSWSAGPFQGQCRDQPKRSRFRDHHIIH